MKILTKENRKEIVRLLQSLGLRSSRTNSTIEEVKFGRFERVQHVNKDGYKWDSNKLSNELWLNFEKFENMVEMGVKIESLLIENNYKVQNYQEVLIIEKI